MSKILIFVEQRDGIVKRAGFENISAALKIADELNLEYNVLTIGNEIENINDVSKYGVNKIYHFKNAELDNYSTSAYSQIINDFAKETLADFLFFANTSLGKDLAPHTAAAIDAGIIMDAVSLKVKSNDIIATRPIYAGKALIDVKLNSEKKVYTLRPNVFKTLPKENGQAPEVIIKEVSSPNLKNKVVEIKKSEGKLDVAEADIIVSGGRGLKGPENFHLVEELAQALGAAVGASRAVVDAGWRPHREQVGQTGKTVSPSLYVACGISGAIQHLAGMSSSKYIVAINKDREAPIFSIADYGITGDVFEILPALTEEIKKVKTQ
jgi:electron transfer flavoprotein alpha subunit